MANKGKYTKKNIFKSKDDAMFSADKMGEGLGNFVDPNGKVWESKSDYLTYIRKNERRLKEERDIFNR